MTFTHELQRGRRTLSLVVTGRYYDACSGSFTCPPEPATFEIESIATPTGMPVSVTDDEWERIEADGRRKAEARFEPELD